MIEIRIRFQEEGKIDVGVSGDEYEPDALETAAILASASSQLIRKHLDTPKKLPKITIPKPGA